MVSINSNAELLDPNFYEDTLLFNNLTVGGIQRRHIGLTVRPPDKFTEIFGDGEFDLAYSSILLRPEATLSYYVSCVESDSIGAFPTDPAGGTYVFLGDDDFAEVAFSDGKQFQFYGQSYDRVYIGSNGYLTFEQGDVEYDPIMENHFSRLGISGLFTDLTPATSQNVSYRQTANCLAVTYDAIPIYGDKTAVNSFQIELFFADGAIRLSYLDVQAGDIIVGLSDGRGAPAFFEESNLSAYLDCCDCGDMDGSGEVELLDLCEFALAWMEGECSSPDWCQRTDFDRSGQVDLADFTMLSENWQHAIYAWSQPEFLLELNGKTWSEPVLLPELNDSQGNNAGLPNLSWDGLTMYFTRYSPSLEMSTIVEATRPSPSGPFTSERVLSELNVVSNTGCVSSWISSDNLRLYYRERVSDTENQIKMAQRDTVGDPWTPVHTFYELHENGYNGTAMSLTSDELTIVWTSARPGTGGSDLWMATRSSTAELFDNIRELTELNTVESDSCPRISPDGLTIYFISSYRDGSTTHDYYKATRSSLSEQFGNVERIEIPGYETRWQYAFYITPDETKLYFTDNNGYGIWLTTFGPEPKAYPASNVCLSADQLNAYFSRYIPEEEKNCIIEASRPSEDEPFSEERIYTQLADPNGSGPGSPWISDDKLRLYFHPAGLIKMSERASIEDEFVGITSTFPELQGDANSASPALTSDELIIVFHSSQSGSITNSDRTLWIASRTSIDEPFTNKRPLDEVNMSDRRHYHPCLSEDGLTLYFSSNREDETDYNIYMAQRNSLEELFGPVTKVLDGVGNSTEGPYVSPVGQKLYFYDVTDEFEGTWLVEWEKQTAPCQPR